MAKKLEMTMDDYVPNVPLSGHTHILYVGATVEEIFAPLGEPVRFSRDMNLGDSGEVRTFAVSAEGELSDGFVTTPINVVAQKPGPPPQGSVNANIVEA